MSEKWATCICTGMLAHVDRGVFGADVHELALAQPLSHSHRGRAVSSFSGDGGGWGKQGWQDKSSAVLCLLPPIEDEVRDEGFRKSSEEAAGKPTLCPEGLLSPAWG